jgi:hypothetical protein
MGENSEVVAWNAVRCLETFQEHPTLAAALREEKK